nr:hypothetical protein [Allomuricauda sp.]
METLKISKDAAITAHKKAKNSGKRLLEDLFGENTFINNIKDRIRSWEDVLEYHSKDPKTFIDGCLGLSDDEMAYRKVKLIAAALNEGWQPDWTDSSQYKYYPWFDMGGSSGSGFAYDGYDDWNSDSDCGSRLCYKSRELAEYAGKQFTDIYKEFLTL